MPTHFFLYWKLPQVLRHLHDQGNPPVYHLGSEQLDKVAVGDVIWIITVEDGDLLLVGRFPVEHLVNREEAGKILNTDDLWESSLHAVCNEKNAKPMNVLRISDLLPALWFNTQKEDTQIELEKDNTINGRRLQTIKRLAPDSVELIEHVWTQPDLLESDAFYDELYKDEENDGLGEVAADNQPALAASLSTLTQEQIDLELAADIEFSRCLSEADRASRLAAAAKIPEKIQVVSLGFRRNADVIVTVLLRAKGICEACGEKAPFARRSDGSPYLEVHHRVALSQNGEDTVENAAALCPNCHRRVHHG